ncbi:uncharacterized protein A4U43_C09F10970 [Asparagus officinalis]|uniref:Uncharacterized protein n=1 Tax=Asparagus officinalis TaxID=4686 RepID=A0A5P1E6Y8_ASPOF|nr:uncharacterized protein A4U43_C09F10970 [Asparagus officinalis]
MVFTCDQVTYSRTPIDRRNHYGHDGTHDPEVVYTFNRNVPLFFEGSSQERIETICLGDYRTLQEIITNEKFLVPHEDISMKPHFLLGDSTPGGNSLFHWEEAYGYYA